MRREPRFVLLLVLALLIGLFGILERADAQVVNPTAVEFTVSLDHSATVLGQAAVTRYELRIYAVGAPMPVTTFDLGKPTPATGQTVTVTNAAIFTPLAVGEYVARVVAIGPGGEGASEATSPFGRLTAPRPPATVTVGQE